MNIKELDYFGVLQLDRKEATFIVENGKGWIDCQGVKYDISLENMRMSDVDKNAPPETYQEFLGRSKPMPFPDKRSPGIFIVANSQDKVWLLAFSEGRNKVMILHMGSYEDTLGTL